MDGFFPSLVLGPGQSMAGMTGKKKPGTRAGFLSFGITPMRATAYPAV
jgi:hypothetical protein